MAVHLFRDYQTQVNTSSNNNDVVAYMLVIFLKRILGYTLVGQTNFDIDSSTYLKASGTGAGEKAGINFGAEATREVSIPSSIRTVSQADIGRFIVLRSDANPLFNSGAFLITGINATDNRYVIDYRSSGSPPAEPADSMPWWLHERDGTFPSTRGANAGTGYRSFGASTCSRTILQSGHSTGWQVRVCLESNTDNASGNNTTCDWTYAPGFDGDSVGDYQVGGEHLHSVLWWNTNTTNVAQMPGQGRINAAGEQYRITMVGDTEGHGVYCFVRRQTGSLTNNANWHFQFGLCEQELLPLPAQPARRLFTMGHNSPGNSSQTQAGLCANSFHYHGLTQGMNGQPVAANIASWSFIETNAQFGGGPAYNSFAANTPHGYVELLPVEMIAGMAENWYNQTGTRIHQFEPRFMGRLPFVRMGRANYGNFVLTPDKSWQHMQYDIYMMWGGPEVLP